MKVVWTDETPNTPGFYWCHQNGKTRMVNVWKYHSGGDGRLFTNEDCGALVTDPELYAGAKWSVPTEPPDPPYNRLVHSQEMRNDASDIMDAARVSDDENTPRCILCSGHD